MAEYTPELNNAVLEAIRRQIAEDEARQVAGARGEATARGLTGSTFESTRVALAQKNAMSAQTDAMVQLALERARMAREDRLMAEDRAYRSAEADKSRSFEEQQADEANRNQLMSSGIEGVTGALGNIGSMYAAKKLGLFGASGGFGGGGAGAGAGAIPGSTAASSATTAVPGAGGAGVGAWGAGIGAGLLGGGYGGQKLGNALFKNKRTEKASRKGASVGAGAGTAIGSIYGPLGSAVGGIIGGGVGSLAGGATTTITGGKAVTLRNMLTGGKAATVKNIAAAPFNIAKNIKKKLFCFDPLTSVEMADGITRKRIGELTLGDETKGGVVESLRVSATLPGTRYNYFGVIVTGSHAVKENGKWVRVENSKFGIPINGGGVVFSLVTSNHRIFINGIEFADEHETNDYESLDMSKSLEALNNGAS